MSDPAVLALLKQEFVNTWLLAKDLESIAAASEDDDVRELCARIGENYDYPVDSIVISPELEVLGHRNAHDPSIRSPRGYLRFLHEALRSEPGDGAVTTEHGAEHGEVFGGGRPPLALTPDRPKGTILDVFRTVPGQMAFTLVPLDVSGFTEGGKLVVDVTVGSAGGKGVFELMALVGEGYTQPVAAAKGVAPGKTARLEYTFRAGQTLFFGARADGENTAGQTNAFLAELAATRP